MKLNMKFEHLNCCGCMKASQLCVCIFTGLKNIVEVATVMVKIQEKVSVQIH